MNQIGRRTIMGVAIFAALLLTASSFASARSADAILGVYWNEDKTRKVEITRDGNIYSGHIVWEVEGPAALGVIGQEILRGFRYSGRGVWAGGEVVAPVDGAVYRGRLWLEDGDLKMRGFVGISLFGKTATMPRVR